MRRAAVLSILLLFGLTAGRAGAIQAIDIAALEEAADELPEGDPERAEIYFRIAEEYGKRWEYQKYLALEAKDAKARAQHEKSAADNLAKAVATWEKLVDDPAYVTYAKLDQALFSLARLHNDAGRTADAVTRWQQMIKNYPQSFFVPDAWVGLGDERFAAADMTQAKANYANANKFPKSRVYAYALYKTGWVWLNEGDSKAAYASFARAAAAAANSREAPLRKAALADAVFAYAGFGAPHKARAAFEKLDRGGSVPLLVRLAGHYEMAGTPAKAATIWRALLAAEPKHGDRCQWHGSLIAALQAANAKSRDQDKARAAATAAGCTP